MQLADKKKRSDRERLPPLIYAALVDSLFQNFAATLIGTVSATIVAVMTATIAVHNVPANVGTKF